VNEKLIAAKLSKWQQDMAECDARMDELAALAGPIVESPLGDAVYRLMGAYTEAVADLIGWDESALSAWWCEHNMGERPMKIGFPREELRTISTIDDLAAFIAEDLRRSECP
jgi:hypothetical protein